MHWNLAIDWIFAVTVARNIHLTEMLLILWYCLWNKFKCKLHRKGHSTWNLKESKQQWIRITGKMQTWIKEENKFISILKRLFIPLCVKALTQLSADFLSWDFPCKMLEKKSNCKEMDFVLSVNHFKNTDRHINITKPRELAS